MFPGSFSLGVPVLAANLAESATLQTGQDQPPTRRHREDQTVTYRFGVLSRFPSREQLEASLAPLARGRAVFENGLHRTAAAA